MKKYYLKYDDEVSISYDLNDNSDERQIYFRVIGEILGVNDPLKGQDINRRVHDDIFLNLKKLYPTKNIDYASFICSAFVNDRQGSIGPFEMQGSLKC